MFDEMLKIAKNKLADINEKINGLSSPQVTVLVTNSNNLYIAVNDTKGAICETLKSNRDTKIIRILTMWKDGGVDLSHINFRKALVRMDNYNNNTDILVQGEEGYLIKKLSATII